LRFQTSDPDIATIFRRIDREVIDLQPDFQRGEVWGTAKKQRLIDTILRKWHVPPVHLVAKGGGRYDVLDGQQRLTAIRDFMKGVFPIDGFIEPKVPEFAELDGLRYGQLPLEVRDEFESFAIRVFELHDFTPDEPHELFFRLNQPMTLTEAEKRNAFIGAARNQVKELVAWAGSHGMDSSRLGFSNARMAYDDLLARFLLTLEQRGFNEKVTALRITTRYRAKDSFPEKVMDRAVSALEFFLKLPVFDDEQQRIRSNKATVHTWLCMAAKLDKEGVLPLLGNDLARTIRIMEHWRVARDAWISSKNIGSLVVFQDRATARVADVSSVVLRDLCGWIVLEEVAGTTLGTQLPFIQILSKTSPLSMDRDPDKSLTRFANVHSWGEAGWL
jgi:hypothetical protein